MRIHDAVPSRQHSSIPGIITVLPPPAIIPLRVAFERAALLLVQVPVRTGALFSAGLGNGAGTANGVIVTVGGNARSRWRYFVRYIFVFFCATFRAAVT